MPHSYPRSSRLEHLLLKHPPKLASILLLVLGAISTANTKADDSLNKPLTMAQTLQFRDAKYQHTVHSYGAKSSNRLILVIMDKWSATKQYASNIVQSAITSANRYGIDPLLVLAVIATESGFKPIPLPRTSSGKIDFAKSIGPMQIIPKWNKEYFPEGDISQASDDSSNVEVGTAILSHHLAIVRGDTNRALNMYNGGPHVTRGNYSVRVKRHYDYLSKCLAEID